MTKRLLLSLLIIMCVLILPMCIVADETSASGEPETTDIKEERTPESPKRNNFTMYYYLMATVALGATAYAIKHRDHDSELVLSIDSIEDNGDGSYIISFGYDNPDDTISFNEGECGVRILKGKAIVLKKPENNTFVKGQHKDSLVAVINSESEIEYYAGNKKIYINGKDIVKQGGNEHDEIA